MENYDDEIPMWKAVLIAEEKRKAEEKKEYLIRWLMGDIDCSECKYYGICKSDTFRVMRDIIIDLIGFRIWFNNQFPHTLCGVLRVLGNIDKNDYPEFKESLKKLGLD